MHRAQPQATAPTLTHRQLAMFRAIMLHGSLSRAAEVSASSQPTLSRELARLEYLLGFTLFDRVRGRLRPTVRALALMQEVERSFVGLDQIAARAQELRTLSAGRLHLACLPALAQALVPRALLAFQQTQPEAAVSVVPLESPWLEQALSEQRFDLGLSETSEAPAGVALQPLLQANEVALLPRGHVLARHHVLAPEHFEGERFISLAVGDPYRLAIDQMFAAANVTRITCLETASAVAVCAMVRQGLGAAIVNPLTALELCGPDLLVRRLSVPITFQVSLLLPEVAAPHPLRDALVAALCATATQMSACLAHQGDPT
ncbi:LysR family transcriptional regulator [Rhodoferax antarcticus]|uniref:LysR family transcriptional regulator n=1 Tax=Rhodoferax antarcticus TaxID=81479 RepID=UPI002224B24E|nr:LysR family transcriptional regulator [Rhodoferax antarcticus]MCW2310553.1 DNA-binding transcriptional LysR family regulator [Rhodoferax antarcticus]